MPDNQLLDETVARDPDRVRIDDEVVTYIDHFVFRLRGRCYALPPGSVEQVTPVQPIVAVPTVPPHVRGVVHLRGRIIAVVDLAALLGVDGDPEPGGNPRLVVIGGAQPFGFVVDGTLGIWAVAAAPIRSD